MKTRMRIFKDSLPFIPLSKVAKADPKALPRKRRPYMSMSQSLNPKLMKTANQEMTKQATHVVDDIWEKEGGSLRNKYFLLDHTAEVLENYRRI